MPIARYLVSINLYSMSAELNLAANNLNKMGYLELDVDPTLDLVA
ncbi:MAG: hypothetical protein ACI94D_000790, partial [Neolewinella sp.]